ncbi:MAG: LamG domain-containing protein, partial [Gammaproteobacteria bacterium]|nr:LamG domain-containing protein [Gammaproteobacteria bacterium]
MKNWPIRMHLVMFLFLTGFAFNLQSAELIHGYDFDDDWHISGQLADQVGSVNGTRTGSGSNIPARVLAPASGIKPQTCYAAEFKNGAFHLDGLGVNTVNGGQNSVTFWMYWDGTNNVMPFGWHTHDVWFFSGSFGFNSGSSDIYGIDSTGLANGWHHVALVFNNGNLTANKMYIDGVQQTLTQRRRSPNNSNAVAASSATISGWRRSSGYRFDGMLDEVNIYRGEISQAEINAELAVTKSCVVPPPPPPPPPAELKHHYEFDGYWDT